MSKTLIVGLDGATFDIIKPLIERGRLPNLERMLANGASGNLSSTIPPVTPAAWTSFFTGKNPGKHGIFDFQRLDYATYQFKTVRNDLHKEKTLWQLLSEAGLRSIVWDVPFTFPPKEINGWMLTGYGTPRVAETVFTYPENLKDQLPEDIQEEIRIALPKVNFDRSQDFINEFREIMAGRRKLLNWLIRNQAWDFFMVVFSITDTMAHVFWTFADPAHPNYIHPKAELYRNAFFEAYELCDELLGELMKAAGKDTVTMVISDHGFGSVRPRQYIYQRLMQGRFMRQGKGEGTSGSIKAYLGRLAADVYIRFPVLREWIKGLSHRNREAIKKSMQRSGTLTNAETLDFSKSKVIPSQFGLSIWLNDQTRFMQGLFPAEAVEKVQTELRDYLLSDIDSTNGKQIISNIHKGVDLYDGDQSHLGPDLVVEYANHFDFNAEALANNPYTEGGHTLEGIFLASGPGIVNTNIEGTSLIDLAPTVLHLLGQAIPPDMDGRVLTDIFTPQFIKENPIIPGEENAVNEQSSKGDGYSEKEEEALLEQLRKLGYV